MIYVASIGEEIYSTLERAIEAAVSGDTIVICRDFSVFETVVISAKTIRTALQTTLSLTALLP